MTPTLPIALVMLLKDKGFYETAGEWVGPQDRAQVFSRPQP
jgi:hypothetical protein